MINPHERIIYDAVESALTDAIDAHMELHNCAGSLRFVRVSVRREDGSPAIMQFECRHCNREITGYVLHQPL